MESSSTDTRREQAGCQALSQAGAELVAGEMDSRSELEAAFQGAYGVFSVQNYWLPTVGFDGEIRQGKNVADAAKAAGVQHLVYSSVGSAHRGMGQKHFESKWMIEQYIHTLDVPYTILRPVAFMDNHNWSRRYLEWNLHRHGTAARGRACKASRWRISACL